MGRLRFFRIALPALLLTFIVVVALTVRERPVPHTSPEPGSGDLPGPRAERIDLVDLEGSSRRLSVSARLVQQDARGGLTLEGISRLLIDRDAEPPLVVRADRGGVEGAPGKRRLHLEGGIEVRDDRRGLVLSLPALDVDEEGGEARSAGAVQVRTSTLRGRASSVVYGLRGQPTVLAGFEMEGEDGSTARSDKARLLDGTRDMELAGNVRLARGSSILTAESLRIWRGDEGKLRRVEATQSVRGTSEEAGGGPIAFRADRADAFWEATGELESALLVGGATVEQERRSVEADRIEWLRAAAGTTWRVRAAGSVTVRDTSPEASRELRGAEAEAEFGSGGRLTSGLARGDVRYRAAGVTAESSSASYATSSDREPRTVLEGGAGGLARVVRGRVRIAAQRIESDPDGRGLLAEGRVEATLLPATERPTDGGRDAIFAKDEAVHFVSSRLTSSDGDRRFLFEGTVRGWQGERHLSADRVEVVESPEELHAAGRVATRMPRGGGPAAGEADFVRVTSSRLDYRAAARTAVYEETVRMRQSEGTVDASRLDVEFETEREGIREMRAAGNVKFDFRTTSSSGMPEPVSGEGDRLVYTPGNRIVRLFGDRAPASVTRGGAERGTTSGRALRYRMEDGALTVESGETGRARIRGSKP